MNNLTILLTVLLFTINVQCESVYKMKVTRVLVTKQDNRYVSASMWISKINRYTNAVNGNLTILQDIRPGDAKVKLKAYEFFHNEYRPFAINLERSFCAYAELEYKSFFYPNLVKIGAHIPEPKCPVPKGTYTFANATVDETYLPANLPFKNSMLEMCFLLQGEEVLVVQLFVILDRDVIIRERYM